MRPTPASCLVPCPTAALAVPPLPPLQLLPSQRQHAFLKGNVKIESQVIEQYQGLLLGQLNALLCKNPPRLLLSRTPDLLCHLSSPSLPYDFFGGGKPAGFSAGRCKPTSPLPNASPSTSATRLGQAQPAALTRREAVGLLSGGLFRGRPFNKPVIKPLTAVSREVPTTVPVVGRLSGRVATRLSLRDCAGRRCRRSPPPPHHPSPEARSSPAYR